MNNDKRIILAIALYAAVITMVLHTLDSEAHERFTSKKQSLQIHTTCEASNPETSFGGLCTESECNEQETFSSTPDSFFTKDEEVALIVDELVNG